MFVLPSMRAYKAPFIKVFVAVGGAGQNLIQTSPNGTTWTNRLTGLPSASKAVTYTGSVYIHVGGGGTGFVQTSTDAINWTSRTLADSSYPCQAAAYGNNIVVIAGAVTATSGKIQYSTNNGVTWANAASAAANAINGATYGNGVFVVVGRNATIQTSTDGSTWTTRTSANTNDMFAACYGNGIFVACGRNGAIQTSTDGTTWTNRTSGNTTTDFYSAAYGNGIYVVGSRAVSSVSAFYTSPDAITWTQRTSTSNNDINSIAYSNTLGLFVAVGGAGTIMTSANGTTWANATSANTATLSGVVF